MADVPAGVRGHRGGTVDVSPVVCGVTNDSYSGMFLYMQRISLVSSFAASLFLGDYAAVDFSDGTIFIIYYYINTLFFSFITSYVQASCEGCDLC